MPIQDGSSCPHCGLPNYAGLCPYCSGNEQAYMDELYPYFGEVYEGQAEKFGLTLRAVDEGESAPLQAESTLEDNPIEGADTTPPLRN